MQSKHCYPIGFGKDEGARSSKNDSGSEEDKDDNRSPFRFIDLGKIAKKLLCIKCQTLAEPCTIFYPRCNPICTCHKRIDELYPSNY